MYILIFFAVLNLASTGTLVYLLFKEFAERREAEDKLDRIIELVSFDNTDFDSDDWYSRFKPEPYDSDYPNR
jgi:hypothetical protein